MYLQNPAFSVRLNRLQGGYSPDFKERLLQTRNRLHDLTGFLHDAVRRQLLVEISKSKRYMYLLELDVNIWLTISRKEISIYKMYIGLLKRNYI